MEPVVLLSVVSVASVAPSPLRFRFSRRASMSALRCARWYAPSGRTLFPVEERNTCLAFRQVVRRERNCKLKKSITNFISPLHDNTIHFCNRSASFSCFSLALPPARHAHARSTRSRSLYTHTLARHALARSAPWQTPDHQRRVSHHAASMRRQTTTMLALGRSRRLSRARTRARARATANRDH